MTPVKIDGVQLFLNDGSVFIRCSRDEFVCIGSAEEIFPEEGVEVDLAHMVVSAFAMSAYRELGKQASEVTTH
ncbi:hypothetical protein HZA26_00050 [Candidatus Nomurabacteria bacterium]|nr:hypothetical protein [Candidatus Nomurabacteria bacterium]